jgi:hypothetical protein
MPIRGMYDTWISGSDVNYSFCCSGLVFLVVFEKPRSSYTFSFTILPHVMCGPTHPTHPASALHNPPIPPTKCSRRRSTTRATAPIHAARMGDMAAIAMASGVAST